MLAVLYLLFNEGYPATAGADLLRPDLCTEAIRLTRVLARLMPARRTRGPESARADAAAPRPPHRTRRTTRATWCSSKDQDRSTWDQAGISEGTGSLATAQGHPHPRQPTLVRSLLCDGLPDELNLTILPIVVCTGVRLFQEMPARVGLELVD